MLPLTTDIDEIKQLLGMCDGVLITGGQDVDPVVYGEASAQAIELTGETSPARDEMEAKLLGLAIAWDVPVLGICRGIQSINALLGGTLWQDLPTQHPSMTEHHGKPPYDKPVHEVDLVPGTPLQACLGIKHLAVNSYHHQAVRTLASELEPMAWASDGILEALYRPASRFLWAVQWHPEFAFKVDEPSRKIFGAFVRSATERAD